MDRSHEYAQLLLRKATEDYKAVEVLAHNSDIDDCTVGFHAQQAIEKSLKAILADKGIEYPFTHNLSVRSLSVTVSVFERLAFARSFCR